MHRVLRVGVRRDQQRRVLLQRLPDRRRLVPDHHHAAPLQGVRGAASAGHRDEHAVPLRRGPCPLPHGLRRHLHDLRAHGHRPVRQGGRRLLVRRPRHPDPLQDAHGRLRRRRARARRPGLRLLLLLHVHGADGYDHAQHGHCHHHGRVRRDQDGCAQQRDALGADLRARDTRLQELEEDPTAAPVRQSVPGEALRGQRHDVRGVRRGFQGSQAHQVPPRDVREASDRPAVQQADHRHGSEDERLAGDASHGRRRRSLEQGPHHEPGLPGGADERRAHHEETRRGHREPRPLSPGCQDLGRRSCPSPRQGLPRGRPEEAGRDDLLVQAAEVGLHQAGQPDFGQERTCGGDQVSAGGPAAPADAQQHARSADRCPDQSLTSSCWRRKWRLGGKELPRRTILRAFPLALTELPAADEGCAMPQ
mmetsp:Transcript_70477/g.206681  ORF Transcript_70477/g.206681 Transcript_70477/m.206681 type:complete len:421 (-) Transcript_70477:41-1303(-)